MTAIAIAALVLGVFAIVLVLRAQQQPKADPALDAMRNDLNIMRESMERSVTAVSTAVSQQMGNMASNVQTALADVRLEVGNRIDAMNQQVTAQINQNVQLVSTTSHNVSERMASVQNTFAGLQKQIGEMGEQARQLGELSKTFTALEKALTAPKLRGGFGESQLENLLKMVFAADQFELQYAFKAGEIADAIIRFPQGIVAIDSKFPSANFRRMIEAPTDAEKKAFRRDFLKDVKKHIDDIAVKYIRPAEGTLPFALMYIPAENVYYEAIIREEESDIYDYSVKKRVLPVSPNSLYAYLQTIVVGLNGIRVSQRAESMLREVEALRTEINKFADVYDTVGKHLRNAQNKFDESGKVLEKVERRVESLTGGPDQPALFAGEEKALGAGAQ